MSRATHPAYAWMRLPPVVPPLGPIRLFRLSGSFVNVEIMPGEKGYGFHIATSSGSKSRFPSG